MEVYYPISHLYSRISGYRLITIERSSIWCYQQLRYPSDDDPLQESWDPWCIFHSPLSIDSAAMRAHGQSTSYRHFSLQIPKMLQRKMQCRKCTKWSQNALSGCLTSRTGMDDRRGRLSLRHQSESSWWRWFHQGYAVHFGWWLRKRGSRQCREQLSSFLLNNYN